MTVMGPDEVGGLLQLSILHPCFVPPHRKPLRDEEVAAAVPAVADTRVAPSFLHVRAVEPKSMSL